MTGFADGSASETGVAHDRWFYPLTATVIAALVFAWRATERVHGTERELVKRQQESATLVTEGTLVAR